MRLRALWEYLHSSLWFVPALTTLGAVALALILLEADGGLGTGWTERWPRLFGAGAEGSRAMLGAIATSMVTVAGVAFSITIVALALASTQYTPRLVRNFMRDRVNQAVLGILVGVFAYCLVVLRTIRSENEGAFVPSVAIGVGFALAFVGIGAFVYFIHHVATSIQASEIVARVAAETVAAIPRLFADPWSGDDRESDGSKASHWTPVLARSTGYVQSADLAALVRIGRDCRRVVRVERGVGEFAVAGHPIASLAGDDPPDASTEAAVNGCFVSASFRTVQQDVGFGIRQIVDVALKALSPGINDVTTAVTCVDYLGAVLCALADRRIPARNGEEGEEQWLVERGHRFEDFVAAAFDQIRQHGAGHPAVLTRLLEALAAIARSTRHPGRLALLARNARLVVEAAERTIAAKHDRMPIELAALRVEGEVDRALRAE